ncbi:MAG: hypothetical protein ABIZ36_01015 [Gemmatimonadaceae bacterium]
MASDFEIAFPKLTESEIKAAQTTKVSAAALFIFIGAAPHTRWLEGCVHLDERGFVLTVQSLFAAGDARSGSVKRVASAVGEGSMAVSFVHAHIGKL